MMTEIAMDDDTLATPDPQPLPPLVGKAGATFALRQFRRLRAEMAENEATHRQIVEESQLWLEIENRKLAARAALIEAALSNWLTARLAEDPDGPKSVALPGGRLASQKGSLSVEVVDEEAFTSWALRNRQDLLRFPDPAPPPPPRPDKAAIKALLNRVVDEPCAVPVHDAEGELIPGVQIVRADRTFKIEVDL